MEQNPFDLIARTAKDHYKLYFYAAVLAILERLARLMARSEALARFPFLVSYHNTLAELGLDGLAYDEAADWWRDRLLEWEEAAGDHLPLRALRDGAGLDHDAVVLLVAIGLIEEDGRFGDLYQALHGVQGQHRPIVALLHGWWHEDADRTRHSLRCLFELGLIQAVNAGAPRLEWALQVPAPIWDALRGDLPPVPAPGLAYRPPDQLLTLDELIVPRPIASSLAAIPSLLDSGQIEALIVRGPQHNGRRTTLGAIARALGRGLLLTDESRPDDERWPLIGPLATLVNALPVIGLDLAPSETVDIARLPGYGGPLGLVLGKQGGVSGPGVERALTVTLDMPGPAARREQWLRGADAQPIEDLETLVDRLRLTQGHIQHVAHLAQTHARLNGHPAITLADARQASRALNRQMLDTLAVPLPVSGDWSDLAVDAQTQRELYTLEARCRHRERLRGTVSATFGSQLNCGVRALFSGPSGTGKTLAACLLASVLHMDIYRLDLSSVVNKYIGETEKNLNQVLARAEELDVILLLDEGDALLTKRTSVQTSNDRYANLETNFLLQRMESFEGILIVTTNAGERIDGAFQRRMDVVVDFRLPDAAERWAIWQLHLPPEQAIDGQLLQDVAARCALTGGQIRNAVLHASLLALDNSRIIHSEHLEEAVRREYRKIGAICPLRVRD